MRSLINYSFNYLLNIIKFLSPLVVTFKRSLCLESYIFGSDFVFDYFVLYINFEKILYNK